MVLTTIWTVLRVVKIVIGNILKGLSHLEVTDSINDIITSLF